MPTEASVVVVKLMEMVVASRERCRVVVSLVFISPMDARLHSRRTHVSWPHPQRACTCICSQRYVGHNHQEVVAVRACICGCVHIGVMHWTRVPLCVYLRVYCVRPYVSTDITTQLPHHHSCTRIHLSTHPPTLTSATVRSGSAAAFLGRAVCTAVL